MDSSKYSLGNLNTRKNSRFPDFRQINTPAINNPHTHGGTIFRRKSHLNNKKRKRKSSFTRRRFDGGHYGRQILIVGIVEPIYDWLQRSTLLVIFIHAIFCFISKQISALDGGQMVELVHLELRSIGAVGRSALELRQLLSRRLQITDTLVPISIPDILLIFRPGIIIKAV